MKKYLVFAIPVLTLCSCAPSIDEKADADTRGILIQASTPHLLDNKTSKEMICMSIRFTIGSLTSERKRISDKTLTELNQFADKCGVSRYEMK
jgi:hypothetical protein